MKHVAAFGGLTDLFIPRMAPEYQAFLDSVLNTTAGLFWDRGPSNVNENADKRNPTPHPTAIPNHGHIEEVEEARTK
ncbi:MAG: hypothetical protein PHW60_01805 [Kiritimatiellae bacterium]|nr:hypothetical protein [Kiritimatiellia bacterium]